MQLPITLLLLMTRITCVVMTAPILGSRNVPIRFRFLLSGFVAMAALPLATTMPNLSAATTEITTAVCSEMVIGILLGLGISILFAAAQAAGSVIGQLSGVQWPTQNNADAGESVSAVSQLFAMLSLAAFAAIGGPDLVLGAVLETCSQLPLGTSLDTRDVVALVTELLQQSFLLTLRGVGPGVAALMISTIVIGLLARTYPQLNMLGLGLNSNQLILFLAIFLTMGGCVWLFVDDFEGYLDLIQSQLKAST